MVDGHNQLLSVVSCHLLSQTASLLQIVGHRSVGCLLANNYTNFALYKVLYRRYALVDVHQVAFLFPRNQAPRYHRTLLVVNKFNDSGVLELPLYLVLCQYLCFIVKTLLLERVKFYF